MSPTRAPSASRAVVACLLPIVLTVGYGARFSLGLPPAIADGAGGIAYVVMVALVATLVEPRLTPGLAALVALSVTAAVECSQLVALPWLDAIRATRLGRLVLGTTFSWTDFGPYFIGALLSFVVLRLIPRA